MDLRKWGIAGVVLGLVVASLGIVSPASAAPSDRARERAEHDRIVGFWTNERVAKAVPRDVVYDPATGRFEIARSKPQPQAKPTAPGGGGEKAVGGSSWTAGGQVLKTTGKVLFEMAGSLFVCSASVATAPGGLVPEKSVALTAGHCAVDESNGQFATNWMFVPDYDSAPAPLTANGSFCAQTTLGCWTTAGGALVVHRGFSEAGGFTAAALPYDFAVAVLGPGGKNGVTDLDALVGSQAIAFDQNPAAIAGSTYAFGYPASGKYRGNDLVYCSGATTTDPATGGQTYGLGCNMTGGSSGGPWLEPFDRTSGRGTLISVNSYGYSGSAVMYGPPLDADAQAVYDTASSATSNTKVPSV